MEVKPSYKQTEVGIIPKDWEVKSFGDIITVRRQKFDPRRADTHPFCVDLEQMGQGTGQLLENAQITEFSSIKVVFHKNDVLFGKLRAYLRKYWFADRDGVATTEIWPFVASAKFTVPEYIFQIVQTEGFIQTASEAYGTHMPRTDWNVVKNYSIPLPPLPEQSAIIAALSDVSALLAAIDALLAKKRLVKQGAMQELLTRKRRLPGFSGEWEVKTLAELFDFSGGFSASRDQLSSEGHCYLHYGDIHGSSKQFIDVQEEYQDIPKLDISLKRISPVSLLDDGDVVFVDASEDDEGASRHVVIINKDKTPFISGLHTIVAKSKTECLDHTYRRYCFQARDIKRQFYYYAVGTKVTGISKTNIAKVVISIPPTKAEQTAIGEILSDMDIEIAALGQKREKTRLLKQGMMQELLTGRIRLI